ncbi:hypothetical protein GGR58DRAFT_414274 [Xylaria digitata]|nr:hypothetical protein GGR58DRAFT_414274 [Xylaria digitata]
MKKRCGIKACQTSTNAHPGHAPEGKTATTGLRSSPLPIQPGHEALTAILADRAGVKGSQIRRCGTPIEFVFTLGRRGFHSSTRVGSVAFLENTEWDEYYRNDSLKSVAGKERLVGW